MGIAYGSGRFCAVGTRGLIFVSEDGKHWRQARNAIREDLRQVFYHPSWDDTGGLRGSFLAVGTAWTLFGDAGKGIWKTLAPSPGGRFLRLYHPTREWSGALLDSGVILKSSPGSEEDSRWWSRIYARTNAALAAAASGGGRFLAVGARGTVVSLADSDIARYDYAFSLSEPPTRADLHAVAWAGDRFVAVGDSGIIVSSPDGEQWEKEPTEIRTALRGVASGMGICVALTDYGILARKAFPAADPDTIPIQDPLSPGLWLSPDSIAFRAGWMSARGDSCLVSPLVNPPADNWNKKLPALPPWGYGLEDFVPNGWDMLAKDSGDLNGDSIRDYAFVIEGQDSGLLDSVGYSDNGLWTGPRILAIAFGDAGGKKLRLIEQSNTFIKGWEGQILRDSFKDGGPFIREKTLVLSFHNHFRDLLDGFSHEFTFAYREGRFRLSSATSNWWDPFEGESGNDTLDLINGRRILDRVRDSADGKSLESRKVDTIALPESISFDNFDEQWKGIDWFPAKSETGRGSP